MKITDTQRAVLEAAAQHPQRLLTSFPGNLKGGARSKVLTALRNAQLIEPCTLEPEVYVVTALGLKAIGINDQAPKIKREVTKHEGAKLEGTKFEGIKLEVTKQDLLIQLLKRAEGATLIQMSQATGWQVHTIRGAMAGALKKKLRLNISSEKAPGADRIYRIATHSI
jgi:hypothetical protein